jgi:basic membrane protein A and related proteins
MRRPSLKVTGVLIGAAAATVAAVVATSASTARKADYKVAIFFPGATNDRSWDNAWSDGGNLAARDFKVKVTLVPNLPNPDQYQSQGSAFAAQGYNLLIFAHGAMDAPAQAVAKQYPNVEVIQGPYQLASASGYANEPPNLGHFDIEQQYGSFQAGLLAGMLTKTNKLATVYGFAFPAITRQVEAFDLGARCVNAHIKYASKATGSFEDAAAARAAASSLFASGVDIMLSAVDQAVQGVVQAAASSKANPKPYVIAQYFDQNQLNPNVVLTSVLFNLQGTGYDMIKRGSSGFKWPAHWFHSYNLKTGRVGTLAPLHSPLAAKVPANVKAKMKVFLSMILSGKLKVPDEFVIGQKLGSGAKIPVASIGCKPFR